MTDAAGAGDAGNPNDDLGGAGGQQGQASDTGALFAELDEATRDWVQTRHENDVVKLAKQAFESDKFAGSAVQVPKADAASEEWDKFYSKIGRPEEASKYDFTVPTDLPENLPYNEEMASTFRELAHSKGLTQSQAADLHDWFVEQQVGAMGAAQQTTAANVQEIVDRANETIENAWGPQDGDTYKQNLDLAGRFFDAIDEKGTLREELQKAGLIGPNQEVLVPSLALGFAKAGAALLTEGSTLGDGKSFQGVNPFEGQENLTQIMQLVKADPNQARTLAKAAGRNPADYGL